ncbi:MAG: hypothetical protein MJA30_37845 [Cytophagales bacterium]|nr:hypothetical protein [Cytophagales bacterium]
MFHLYFKGFTTVLALLLMIASKTSAQNKEQVPYRPKLVEFSFQSLNDHRLTPSQSPGAFSGDASNEKRSAQLTFKAIAPVLLRDSLKIGVQLKFDQQQFLFNGHNRSGQPGIGNYLGEQDFRSLSARLLVQKKLNNGANLNIVSGVEFNDNNFSFHSNTRRLFVTGIYQQKISKRRTVGGGLLVSHNDLGLRVFPIITLEEVLSPKWTLNLTLPKEVATRYRVNASSYLIAKAALDGWRYNLSERFTDYEANSLNISRLDLRYSLAYERGLNDWLWVGIEAGWNQNLRYFLAESGQNYRNAMTRFDQASAPFVQLSLFLVPPSKFYKNR